MIFGWGFMKRTTDFPSSSRIFRTRLPRSIESSRTKRSCGVYFRTTPLADQALDALAVLQQQFQTFLLLVAVAEDRR